MSSGLATQTCTLVPMLKGGIGNQLFQILVGLRLARLSNCGLAFDLTALAHDTYGRTPVLDRVLPGANRVKAASLSGPGVRLLREEDAAPFEPWLLGGQQSLPADVSHLLLDGYWQDSRYVDAADVAGLARHLEATLEEGVRPWVQRIRSATMPTAVHLRRHDYKHHGLCAEDYYLQSLRWLQARRGALDLFVFSDEPHYTAHLLSGAGFAHTLVRTGDDLADLYLMSLCRNHVIANSTFSWWGARLSQSDTVIAPEPWSCIHTPSPGLCPPHWRRVAGAVKKQVSPLPEVRQALDQETLRVDRETFLAQGSLPADWALRHFPCLEDATRTTAIDAHYVYHTSWAARRLHERPVAEHVDIGSDHRFTTIASAFQPMRFLDYRPLQVELPGLVCGHANLLQLDMASGSVPSLSCMHVVEHIGLGRYGDPINFHGADIAMAELERVLAPGGWLYFVVPVGQPAVEFNAHRIFRAGDIVAKFSGLDLVEFALVSDDGRFHTSLPPSAADGQRYACGCFLFRKPQA